VFKSKFYILALFGLATAWATFQNIRRSFPNHLVTLDGVKSPFLVPALYPNLARNFGMIWRFAPMADAMVDEFHSRDLVTMS
jgi:hypothetical protein